MRTEHKRVSAVDLLKLYQAFHPGEPFTNEDVFNWGLSHGYDITPQIDLKAAALKKIKQAVKKATITDPQGRKVPQYIYVGDEDGQLPLWSELSITPQPVVQKSIDAHRKKGIQTFVAAQIIVDSYNDNFNLGEPVTLDLFVADDVAEEVIIRWNNGSGADELGDDDEASDEEQD